MPQVPTLDNHVRLEAAPNVQQRPLAVNGLQELGAGLNDAGGVLDRVRKEEQLKADRAVFMEKDRQTDAVANDLYAKASSTQLKDAIGITPKSVEEFDRQTGDIANTLTTPRQKEAYQQAVNTRRSQLQREIGNHEGRQTQAFYASERENYKDQAHVNAVTYYQDPARIDGEIDKVRAVVDQTPGLSPEQRDSELGLRRSGIYAGVVQRYLANDNIKGAEAYYSTVRDKTNGDKAAWIENAITDAKRIAENRARALADHREAIGDRTLNEIDRQIASGVPATDDMWAKWQTKVLGTPAAAEFKDRMAAEKEVQTVLRMPVSDQVAFVQAQQKKLDQGGDLRQAANFQRLAGAVQKNVTLLQTDPLVYQSSRVGAQVPPLDLGALDSGNAGALADAMNDRAATLQTMRRQYGAQVPQKLLLPQEAAQIAAALGQASSPRAAAMFGALRNAIGDDQLYASTVQQLAPDNPVKALAGLLAAKDRTATLDTHWFRPNDTVNSQQVASLILDGQDIIRPPKAEKATDGTTKLGLYLPDEKPLQDAFQAQVGTAFADRPKAAQDAYQAVKAYYVGRAAKDGRLAADHQDVDSHIVREAVRGILGNVVDVNGRGEVLAPWGMEAGAFKDAARAAFGKQDIAWPGGAQIPFDVLGLKPAGADSYYVTAGRSFLQGKDGNPVVLKIGDATP